MISATWWTNSAIYIPEYSQYWFQHAALNLITKSGEFTLLQYSTTLSSYNHIILYHIWYLQHDKLSFYIYSRILPVLISSCCIEFNHYKTWIHSITVFYNTLMHNHIILYHIWYLQHDKLSFYINSRILPVLISTCCIEFNQYKTWIYSITVFYNTLKLNRIILYHIWYLLHDEPTVLYIFQNTPSIDFNMLHWI